MKAAAIVPAAGSGSRMGHSDPKQFCELAGIPLLVHTVLVLRRSQLIDFIIVVAPVDHLQRTEELLRLYGLEDVRVVAGGRLRQDSVKAGLDALPPEIELVLVHDGARPFVSGAIIEQCLQKAAVHGAAMAAIPVKDTLKSVAADRVSGTVEREGVWQAQTPQAVRVALLVEAFAAAERDSFIGTDEAALLERIGCQVHIVLGSEKNIKITNPEDLQLAEAMMGARDRNVVRVGQGYDVHQLIAGRALILGGVAIDYELGLLGHSDADVLTHALCDALLGAIGEGDIGNHFPDTDEQYKNISSLVLLERVVARVVQKGFSLVNADMTVLAQSPKLAPYIEKMRQNLAAVCKVSAAVVNIKATTTEELGFVGRREGIAAQAIVLLGKTG